VRTQRRRAELIDAAAGRLTISSLRGWTCWTHSRVSAADVPALRMQRDPSMAIAFSCSIAFSWGSSL